MSTTEGMASGGFYDAHDEYQRDVAASGARLIEQCVDAVPFPTTDATFVIADYGASTGSNSVTSLTTAVRAVRARRGDQPVAVLHNDLPTNDWNELFHNIAAAPDAYLSLQPPVLPMASAISFFEPAAVRGSVHVGLSTSAAHWLRTQPDVVVPEGFYLSEATGEARAAIMAAADADWTSFLLARASDLASGGRLLVQMVGTEVDAAGEHHVTARGLLRAMAEVARDMVVAGTLDPDVVDRYVLGVVARTPAEARAPLERAPLQHAFDVVECRTDPVANPYYVLWQDDRDSATYASSYAGFVRGFTESSLRTNLFGPGARGQSADAAVDDFFTRLTARFAGDPARDRFEDWTLTVVVTRR